MKIKISEFFYSIQGETSFAGLPAVFLRLSQCNLRCSYCDTEYAWEAGESMSIESILSKICAFDCNLLVITGGEPLLQPDVFELVAPLNKKGKTVLVETNGSLDISVIPNEALKIMDVKCPGSGENKKNLASNLNYLTYKDEIKFVISSREDYDWALNFIKTNKLSKHRILFSPTISSLAPKSLAEWILENKISVRLQLQLHKIIWGNDAKGV